MGAFRGILAVFSFFILLNLPFRAAQGATITVTEPTDAFDGGVCTLRNAIESVNNAGDFGGCDFDETQPFGTNDTINLTAQSYILSIGETNSGDRNNNATGDLDIHTSVSILGAGSSQTEISGSGFPTGEEDRVLHIVPTPNGAGIGPSIIDNLQGMTLRDGNAIWDDSGGGLQVDFFDSEVNLLDVVVTQNTTSEDGGGIANSNGRVSLTNSQVINNNVPGDAGGINNNATFVLLNSVVAGNTSEESGGGIRSNSDTGGLLLVNSTVSGNTASSANEGDGGGIAGFGNLVIINSTISNNTAAFVGGGIRWEDNSGQGNGLQNAAGLFNVTVAQNRVTDASGEGGGICFNCPFATGFSNAMTLMNTLVAENTGATSPDCQGDFTSGGYNLIGDATNCNGFTATGDQTGVPDPGIGPLENNGGPTETHGLLSGSTAIERGNDVEGCQAADVDQLLNNGTLTLIPLTQDQRAFPRPIAVLDPNDPVCDIGAFEFQTFDFDVTKDDGLNGQPIDVGDQFTYTITVTNPGPGNATNVTLSDPLPATLNFVSVTSSQGTCSQAGGTVSCDLGTLNVGETATVQISVQTTAAGTLTNVVTITSQGDDQSTVTKTAQSTTLVQTLGIGISIFGSGCALSVAAVSPAGSIGMAIALVAGLLALRKFRSKR